MREHRHGEWSVLPPLKPYRPPYDCNPSELKLDTAEPATLLRRQSQQQLVQEEMRNAKLDLGYRDFCAHLLIPLNQCRRDSMYLPWKCEHERHEYEKCQYFDYKRRLLQAST